MTVLCLTELDGDDPADASLRALTLGRSLGDPSLAAVVFADSARCPPLRWPITASPTCT